MKIISWNVNGLRASVNKGLIEKIGSMDPDILCLQEIKATGEQVQEALSELNGYHIYTNSAERKGYSGTAILLKGEPQRMIPDMGIAHHDKEGRILTADLGEFYIVNAYVPNSGAELARLDYRKTWDQDMLKFLKGLEKEKPVIYCGDLNVAHKEIDIARPKANYNKTAGFTQTEIDGMDAYLSSDLVDTWREQHPDEVKYSWWSFRGQARAKNIGWRIDYVLVSRSLFSRVTDSFIWNDVEGSDHCPVGIILK